MARRAACMKNKTGTRESKSPPTGPKNQVRQTELELRHPDGRIIPAESGSACGRPFDLFQRASVAYLLFDEKHRLADINAAATELVGVSRSRLKGGEFSPRVMAQHRKRFHAHVRRVLAGGAPSPLECCLHHERQGLRWVRFESQGWLEEAGGKRFCLSVCIDFTEHKRAQEALQRSQAELSAIHDGVPIMMCLVNEQQEVESMNRAMEEFVAQCSTTPAGAVTGPLSWTAKHAVRAGELFGCLEARDGALGCGAWRPCQQCPLRLAMAQTLKTGKPCRQVEGPMTMVRQGETTEIRVLASTTMVRANGRSRVLVCLEDITDRRQIELQLQQAQKMEAIGQLAGGVAHDFNNILAAMLLSLDLLQADSRLHRDLIESLSPLENGARRAAELTRQLLQFSRRQVMRTELFNLNEALDNSLQVLTRLLGETIDLRFEPGDPPPWVEADRRMLDQMITSLCLNARDAMSGGGRLIVGTKTEDVTALDVKAKPDARAGSFACVTVTDTGCGMDAATLKRLFEPFFTTKDVGQGTGLSLASVHGIIKQHRGWVDVESAPGVGTTFRVYLPVAAAPQALASSEVRPLAGGHESILVVEDDQSVRQVLSLALRHLGYGVFEAANGVEAVKLWQSHGDQINLLFTDIVMPEGMTGRELAERLRGLKPDLRVVLTSGYSAEWTQPGGDAAPGMRFLGKPYQMAEMARVVRECLDAR